MTPEIYQRGMRWVDWLLIVGGVALMLLAASSSFAKAESGVGDDRGRSVEHVAQKRIVHKAPKKQVAHVKKPTKQAQKKPDTKPIEQAGDTSLLAKARAYLGTNPTGRGSLWCAAFMAMIAPRAARRVKNPNWARDWAALPHVPPQVGAIAVLSRGRGGHVGVVSGFDGRGNPKVISGNHNNVVGEGVYPKSRVIAYVSPLEQVAMVKP